MTYAHEMKRTLTEWLSLASDALVITELGILNGVCFADLVVLGDDMHGLEIKGAHDSLGRLRSQVDAYDAVFDRCTIVVDERHERGAIRMIPPHWGVVRYSAGRYEEIRPAQPNPRIEPASVARLLWKEEAVALALLAGFRRSIGRKRKPEIDELLAATYPLDEIRHAVRSALRRRKGRAA